MTSPRSDPTPTGLDPSQAKRVLVAGIGNLFLTDDGFGSEVARQLVRRPMPAGVKVVDFGIRGMHLAYELLDGYDALVVVDALPGEGAPGDLSVLQVGPDDLGEGELDAHGMAPVAVLASLGQLGGSLPPTYIVGCQPADIDEGIGLSPAVAAAVEPAVQLVLDVLQDQLGLSSAGLQRSAYVESTSSVEFDRENLP
jgi:hydrogenase maturation protease